MKKDIIEILNLFDKNKTIGEIFLTVLDKEIEIYQKQTQGSDPKLVDLGLPSGNLWMTHNMGASCETDYGHYYQFGSLIGYQGEEALKHSTWETCPFNNGKDEFDEEYFLENRSNWFDKDNNLKPEFDVVTQTYGNGYKIPTNKDFHELLNNTTSKDIKYENSGKSGKLFTSKINGKTLFIPYSGSIWDGSFDEVGSDCSLWSSRLNSGNLNRAYSLYCDYSGEGLGYSNRYSGSALRGIKVKRD